MKFQCVIRVKGAHRIQERKLQLYEFLIPQGLKVLQEVKEEEGGLR